MNEVMVVELRDRIVQLPGRPAAMLATDLAEIYHTKVKKIHQAVKRNPDRFPSDFAFYLTRSELKLLRSQTEATKLGGAHQSMMAFTREGSNMLSGILHTPVAVQRSVQIMRAFTALEKLALRQASRRSQPVPSPTPDVTSQTEAARLEGLRQGLKLAALTARFGQDNNVLDRLIYYRNLGLTQKETAKLLDLSRDQVQRLEHELRGAGIRVRQAEHGQTRLRLMGESLEMFAPGSSVLQ